MKKLFSILAILTSCTLEVPVDEIEIPPVENNTTIVVTLPDGLSVALPLDAPADAQDSEEDLCEFQEMPNYQTYGGEILYCTGIVNRGDDDKTCCVWGFPESTKICEEKWCLSLSNKCGWEMVSWDCHSY